KAVGVSRADLVRRRMSRRRPSLPSKWRVQTDATVDGTPPRRRDQGRPSTERLCLMHPSDHFTFAAFRHRPLCCAKLFEGFGVKAEISFSSGFLLRVLLEPGFPTSAGGRVPAAKS